MNKPAQHSMTTNATHRLTMARSDRMDFCCEHPLAGLTHSMSLLDDGGRAMLNLCLARVALVVQHTSSE